MVVLLVFTSTTTSAFGADGSGKDVSFHGGAANELMKYTAADHTLKFVGSGGGSTFLTLGGDATSEFAVDVADGSANRRTRFVLLLS